MPFYSLIMARSIADSFPFVYHGILWRVWPSYMVGMVPGLNTISSLETDTLSLYLRLIQSIL